MIPRKKKNFTTAQLTDIITSYQEGATLEVLSRRYNCSHTPIKRVLRNAEVSIRTHGEHNRALIQDGKKLCSLGKHWVELENFYSQERYDTGYLGHSYACKPCMQAKSLAEYESRLFKKYGLTVEAYHALLEAQSNSCAICSCKTDDRLVVDHCHTTDKVRGLLCHACNKVLGLFQDDPDRLRKAANYLENADANDQGSGKRSS